MLDKLIEAAKMFGYSTLRLDTIEFMATAHSIYESAGFKVRDKYQGTSLQSGAVGIFSSKRSCNARIGWDSG